MEIPTARVMKKDTWRIGVSQVDPIRTIYAGFSPFNGLELGGRVTEYLHTRPEFEQGIWEGYGNVKDKAIDLKFRFLPEGKYLPAMALGVMDPHGTRLQAAQYLVFSKQVYPFDFIVGFGNGRYGEDPLPSSGEDFEIEIFSHPKAWLEDAQLFYGIQFAPSEKFALMVEYSPVRHERFYRYDPETKDRLKSKYNVGLRWKPLNGTEFDLTYQRGNKIGANVLLAFDIGKPLIPIADIPYREKSVVKSSPFVVRLTNILSHEGFSDISVEPEDDTLWIEAQNDRYFYSGKAIAVVLRSVAGIMPEDLRHVGITLKENDIPLMRFTTDKIDVSAWQVEKLTTGQYLNLARYETDVWRLRKPRGEKVKAIEYAVEPSLQTFLNDPSGFFKYRFGVRSWLAHHPWRGCSLVAGLEGYPFNNIETINEPLSIPVRSDIALYEKNRVALSRLMFDQIGKTSHELYGRIAAGWLEIEYAGLDVEFARPFLDGRLMLGLGGSVVKKRKPDTVLELKRDDVKHLYTTTFVNTRLNFPEIDTIIDLKAGRFLAGDLGARVTLSKFIHGVVISVWYGITDTSDFEDEYNRGYRDKGIAVSIPLRLLNGKESRVSYQYALSPWTRDVAQDIYHHQRLFDFIGRNSQVDFLADRQEMLP